MAIRKATVTDLDTLLEIYAIAREFMASYGNTHQWQEGYPSRKILMRDLEADRLFVDEIDGEIEGCFVFFIGEDPSYLQIDGAWLNQDPYGVVHRIASRRRIPHIGEKMMQYCIDQVDTMRIDTHKDNIPMQRMLKKFGFVHVGTIELVGNHEKRLAFQLTK